MVESELYSKGAYAKVRKVTDQEIELFPAAELVREEISEDPYWFKRSYYRHRVAKILFPDLFPDVVGARQLMLSSKSMMTIHPDMSVPNHAKYLEQLFSRKAHVPEDHAIYSLHMEVTHRGKRSLCSCDACKRHRVFHAEKDLEISAKAQNDQTSQIGIDLPWDDSTDYCLTDKGILFFEMQRFSWSQIVESLNGMNLDSQKEAIVRSLLKKIHDLHILSRNTHFSQESGSIRTD